MWRQGHYRAAVESASDSILVIDAFGVIQSVNPATSQMFGYGADELIGEPFATLVTFDGTADACGPGRAFAQADLQNLIGDARKAVGRRRDGTGFPIDLSFARWAASDGQIFFTGILRSVAQVQAAQAALAESQAWLQTVSDTALVGLLVIDRDHRIRFANRAYGILFNLGPGDVSGSHLRDVLPDLYGLVATRVDAAFTGLKRSYETVFPDAGDGTQRRYLSGTYEPSRNAAGEEVVVVVVTDVTELKRKEMVLRASRDLLQSVVDGTGDAIFAKDAGGRYVMVNDRGARMAGLLRDEIIGRTDFELFDAPTAKLYRSQDQQITRSGQPMSIERVVSIEGQTRHIVATKQAWTGPDGTSGGVVGITRDVTEQHLIEIEREQVAKRLTDAQEAERLRIARELHDQVGQDLTGLAIGLKRLEEQIAPEGRQHLARLRSLTDQISQTLHRTAMELRPTSLEDFGLRQAVTSNVADWGTRFGLQVDLALEALDGAKLSSDAELAIYRCVQESLTNIVKHAQASCISVVARRTADVLRLVIEDDGVGFDCEAVPKGNGGGLGILGMRERLHQVGGHLIFEAAPRRGTMVFITVGIESGGAA